MPLEAQNVPLEPQIPSYHPYFVQWLIEQTFGEGHIMLEVARAESRLDPAARNKTSTAKGVYQVLDGSWKWYECEGDVLNAWDNIQCAKKIYDKDKLRPWEASRHTWGKFL